MPISDGCREQQIVRWSLELRPWRRLMTGVAFGAPLDADFSPGEKAHLGASIAGENAAHNLVAVGLGVTLIGPPSRVKVFVVDTNTRRVTTFPVPNRQASAEPSADGTRLVSAVVCRISPCPGGAL